MRSVLLLLLLLLLLTSCRDASPPPNATGEAGIALGKRLFFDTALSGNDKLSCASCHVPALAFTDGQARSRAGASGRQLHRNTPPLFNLAWAKNGLFWDGGAKNLESLSLAPLRHPDEMATDLKTLPHKLSQRPPYPELFRTAFGTDSITLAQVLRALAQYERSLVSFAAPFDRQRLDPTARAGYEVYQQHCAACHREGLFTDHEYHNNGLDATFPADWEHPAQGRYRITLDSNDLGKYRTPTLRNLAFTAPYMHDGRLPTLSAVLDHYTSGIQDSPTLAPLLRGGIPLTTQERKQLLAFLQSLNDSAFVGR